MVAADIEPPAPRRGTPRRGSAARARYAAMLEEIRMRICLLHYPPGHRLGEDDLAAEFGISRTPLRRVLNRLEFEGLLESRQGVGTFVTDIDLNELVEVCAFRMALAALIGDLSPVPTDRAHARALREIGERIRELADRPDLETFARLNLEHAHLLHALIGNRPLREESERLFYRTTRIWLLALPAMDWRTEVETFAREIDDTVIAIENHDADTVGMIRRNAIALSLHRMLRHLGQDTGTV